MKHVLFKSQLKSELQRAKSIFKMFVARTLNKIVLVLFYSNICLNTIQHYLCCISYVGNDRRTAKITMEPFIRISGFT